MIRPDFLTNHHRQELEAIVRSSREDHGVGRRANAILLLDDGWSCERTGQALYLDDDTIRRWYKEYRLGGIDRLTAFDLKGSQPRMSKAQDVQLCRWLEGRFCRSSHEIRAYMKTEFGLAYSHSGTIKLLGRLGFEDKKPKALPRVCDEQEQQAFIDLYEKLLNDLVGEKKVNSADAVHPEYQTKPAFGWVKRGSNLAVKTTSGRGRVNIHGHGAVNLQNFDCPFIEPTTVDGQNAVQLLAKIEAQNPGKCIIHVIWDNAPYHRGPDIRAFLSRAAVFT